MIKIKNTIKKMKSFTPLWCKISIVAAAFSIILYISFIIFPDFSDFFNRYPASFLRAVLSYVTYIFPFSVAESIIMLSPLILVLVVIKIIKVYNMALRDMFRMLVSVFSLLCIFLSSFTVLFASGYRGSTLDKKLGLESNAVSGQDLYDTAIFIHNQMDPLVNNIDFYASKSSVMPFSFFEMNDLLQNAYKKASKKYDFLPSFTSKIKPIILSEPMTYTHISGVYTFFTGESNINTNFPDYTLPYTAAHELVHQRGIAREDEANFVAFLVCIESDDSYIKYSGYMGLYEYVISALYKADKKLYNKAMSECNRFFIGEMTAYNAFFDKYSENVVANISGAVNNGFLQSQGQSSGTKSYGMVVDLAVAYVKSIT